MKIRVIAIIMLTCAIAHGDEWRVRDVAANSAWVSSGLDLKLEPSGLSCAVSDLSGKDRAITLAYCIPLDAISGTWCDDPQRSRVIDATQNYSNLSDKAGGVHDEASLYPLAVVIPPSVNAAKPQAAVCIAVPPDQPRLVRFVYVAAKKELRAEFDFGLSRETGSRADASVVTFEVPAKWAFRRAIAKYWEMYPNAFARRVKAGGNWMPFGEIGPIKDAGDFGFKFHEIAQSQVIKRILDDDERVGCGSFPYVEPPSYWQQYAGKDRGTYEQRQAQLEDEANKGSGIARGTIVSGILRGSGKRDLYLDPVAYTAQQPWGSDADPDLTDTDAKRGWPSKGAYEFERLATMLGGREKPNLGVDGVYVDSMEGWTEFLDYDRSHWKSAKFPLTFDPSTKKVGLLNLWGTVSFVKKTSDALHERGMPLMGNDAFYRRWQFAAFVDVPGREYTWLNKDGKPTPVEDERYLFIRAMSGKKPYLMLMNNKFDDASIMEPYFQRSIFYGVWPSMFNGQTSASDVSYFDNPAWYNRDRALFKKYLPMVRKLDDAGWEPVPFADVSPADARIERYGSFERGNLAFTIHNAAASERDVTITMSRNDLKLTANVSATEWFGGAKVPTTADDQSISFHLAIPADGYDVVSVLPG